MSIVVVDLFVKYALHGDAEKRGHEERVFRPSQKEGEDLKRLHDAQFHVSSLLSNLFARPKCWKVSS